MSENSSPSLPISAFPSGDDDDLTADLDLGFDGAEDILRTLRRIMGSVMNSVYGIRPMRGLATVMH